MFETTVVESKPRTRPKANKYLFGISIASHVLVGAGLVAYSLIFTSFPMELPKQFETYRLAALPFIPPPPPPPPKGNPTPKTNRQPPPLPENIAPTIIPEEIPEVLPQQAAVVVEDLPFDPNAATGVEGGVADGADNGVDGGLVTEVRPADAPVVVARDDKLPMAAVSQTYPQYPERARVKGIHGSVLIRYKIGKNGRVVAVEILRPADKLLNEAAVNAIKWWRFKPLIVQGEPVEVVHELTVRFELQGGRAFAISPAPRPIAGTRVG